MNINRTRPPKGCDPELWLSQTVNDAIRDAIEAGLDEESAAIIVLSHGRFAACAAGMSSRDIASVVHLDRKAP